MADDDDWDPFADPADGGEEVQEATLAEETARLDEALAAQKPEADGAQEAARGAEADPKAQLKDYLERFAGRPYAFVVHGATGFSGTFLVEHLDEALASRGARGLAWAISGRDADKLRRISGRCRTSPAVIQASTPQELSAMAGSTQVVCSAVGPCRLAGEAVVAACVEQSAHYVDITGELPWIQEMVEKYHDKAKAKGVMVVHCAAFNCAIDDLACYMLVKHLGPLRQYREYFFQVGPTGGGSFLTNLALMEGMTPKAFEAITDPFSLGGRRACGLRSEDADCREVASDPLFEDVWPIPCYNGPVGSRMIRRSSQLFDEAPPSSSVRYGDEFRAVIRDLAPSKAAAERQIRANAPLTDPAVAAVVAQSLQGQVDRGLAPKPGAGPIAEYRAIYFSEVFGVAEGENGNWAHVHYTGPEAYEVTAIACITAAQILVEEPYKIRPWERGGVLTPAFAFDGSTYAARLQARAFGRSGGPKITFKVKDGKPSEEQLKAAMDAKRKAAMQSEAWMQARQVEPWAPSLLGADEVVWLRNRTETLGLEAPSAAVASLQ